MTVQLIRISGFLRDRLYTILIRPVLGKLFQFTTVHIRCERANQPQVYRLWYKVDNLTYKKRFKFCLHNQVLELCLGSTSYLEKINQKKCNPISQSHCLRNQQHQVRRLKNQVGIWMISKLQWSLSVERIWIIKRKSEYQEI